MHPIRPGLHGAADFIGGFGKIRRQQRGGDHPVAKGLGWNPYCYVKIGCDDCNLFINDTFRNESITIDKWNRRPDSTMHKIQK
jgi:hypothetical protein